MTVPIAWRGEFDDKNNCTNALLGIPDWISILTTRNFVLSPGGVASSRAVPTKRTQNVGILQTELKFKSRNMVSRASRKDCVLEDIPWEPESTFSWSDVRIVHTVRDVYIRHSVFLGQGCQVDHLAL